MAPPAHAGASPSTAAAAAVAAAATVAPATAAPPPQAGATLQQRQHQHAKAAAADQAFSALALALWVVTSTKSALASPLASHHNLQSAAGAAAIATVLLWPTLAAASYARWRVPALAGLRLLLMGLPYNFTPGAEVRRPVPCAGGAPVVLAPVPGAARSRAGPARAP